MINPFLLVLVVLAVSYVNISALNPPLRQLQSCPVLLWVISTSPAVLQWNLHSSRPQLQFSGAQLSDILVFIRELSGSGGVVRSDQIFSRIKFIIIPSHAPAAALSCQTNPYWAQSIPPPSLPQGRTTSNNVKHHSSPTPDHHNSHQPVRMGLLVSSVLCLSPLLSAGVFVGWMLVFSTDSEAWAGKKLKINFLESKWMSRRDRSWRSKLIKLQSRDKTRDWRITSY